MFLDDWENIRVAFSIDRGASGTTSIGKSFGASKGQILEAVSQGPEFPARVHERSGRGHCPISRTGTGVAEIAPTVDQGVPRQTFEN